MRWLDPLGRFKWPSVALCLAPLAAYPFWQPEAEPLARCGTAAIGGQAFAVHADADRTRARLVPVAGSPAGGSLPPALLEAAWHDGGAATLDDPALVAQACAAAS